MLLFLNQPFMQLQLTAAKYRLDSNAHRMLHFCMHAWLMSRLVSSFAKMKWNWNSVFCFLVRSNAFERQLRDAITNFQFQFHFFTFVDFLLVQIYQREFMIAKEDNWQQRNRARFSNFVGELRGRHSIRLYIEILMTLANGNFKMFSERAKSLISWRRSIFGNLDNSPETPPLAD